MSIKNTKGMSDSTENIASSYLSILEAYDAETLIIPDVITTQHSFRVVVEHFRVFLIIAWLTFVQYCHKQRLGNEC